MLLMTNLLSHATTVPEQILTSTAVFPIASPAGGTPGSATATDGTAEKVAAILTHFELGPMMQIYRNRFIPRDIEPTSFLPLKLWVNRVHNGQFAAAARSNDNNKKQRAQEALARALAPLVQQSLT
jgi:hypothetical protein